MLKQSYNNNLSRKSILKDQVKSHLKWRNIVQYLNKRL
jgi:hypothetical protein